MTKQQKRWQLTCHPLRCKFAHSFLLRQIYATFSPVKMIKHLYLLLLQLFSFSKQLNRIYSLQDERLPQHQWHFSCRQFGGGFTYFYSVCTHRIMIIGKLIEYRQGSFEVTSNSYFWEFRTFYQLLYSQEGFSFDFFWKD